MTGVSGHEAVLISAEAVRRLDEALVWAARKGASEAATAWRMARSAAAVMAPLGRGGGISSGGCWRTWAANAGGRWAW